MKNKKSLVKSVAFFMSLKVTLALAILSGCGVSAKYSMTGTTTTAKTISITEFYNNADLGPANLGQAFSNRLKNYFVQNSSLAVVAQEGELQLEGEIMNFSLSPIAPTATSDPNALTSASATRLTITVKATYINTLDENMSFNNKTFSFYKDFPNEITVSDVQESFTNEIFDRIINDIFNASVANW